MNIETEVWKSLLYKLPESVPSMISIEEQRYLYWLGESVWTGRGDVVEIGSWLGGSTLCLASGMRASGYDGAKRMKVFDNFIWREFMSERAPLPLKPGASFQSFFLSNVSEYDDIVDAYRRALPDEVISGDHQAASHRFVEEDQVPLFERVGTDPVELLFIDGAKSWRGMLFLLKTLREGLLKDVSYLICQDYKYWESYWVPVMMCRLSEYVEPVHDVFNGATVTFRVGREIPASLLDSLPDSVDLLDADAVLEDIATAVSLLHEMGDERGAANVSLAKVTFLAHKKRVEEAVSAFNEIRSTWPPGVPAGQLERARAYLAEEFGVPLKPVKMRSAPFVKRVAARLKRMLGSR